MNHRPLAAALLVASLALGACQSSGGSTNDPARAMARLPEPLRAAADGYISGISDLSRQLTSVTDTASARAAMPRIEGTITRASQSFDSLQAANPQARADISEAFGQRIRNVNDDFAAQVNRIKGTPGLGTTLGPLLDKVRIYR